MLCSREAYAALHGSCLRGAYGLQQSCSLCASATSPRRADITKEPEGDQREEGPGWAGPCHLQSRPGGSDEPQAVGTMYVLTACSHARPTGQSPAKRGALWKGGRWAPCWDTPSFLDALRRTQEKGDVRTDVIDFRAAKSHSIGVERAVTGKRNEAMNTQQVVSGPRCRRGRETVTPFLHGDTRLLIPTSHPSLTLSNLKAGHQGSPLCVETSVTSLPLPPVHGSLPPKCRMGPKTHTPPSRKGCRQCEQSLAMGLPPSTPDPPLWECRPGPQETGIGMTQEGPGGGGTVSPATD